MSTPRSPRLITLILMTAATTLSLNMFLPALPAISEAFAIPYGTATFAIGGYLAMTAVLALVIGPLSDRFGRRPVGLATAIIFLAASVGATFADSWLTFLACRLAQGVMVSGYVLVNAVIRDTRDHTQAASLLAFIAGAMAIAPILGPIIGGVLLDLFGWRSNFALYTGLGLVLLLAVSLDLSETRQVRESRRLHPGPLLRDPRFWAYALTVAVSTCAFYGFLAGAPIVVTSVFGLSGTTLGVGLGSITAGFMAGSFTGSRLSPRFGPDRVMVAGRIVSVTGLTAGFLLITAVEPSAYLLFGTTVFIGIGNGLTTPAGNAGVLSVRPELAGTASGFTSALTVGLGAVATTAIGWALESTSTPFALLAILLGIKVVSLIAAIAAVRLGPGRSSG